MELPYAHAFASAYPSGRFLIECDRKATIRDAVTQTSDFIQYDFIRTGITEEERMQPKLYFAAIKRCLRERIEQKGRLLLLLDNVTDPNLLSPEETDQLTSLGPQLHLLATTRLPAGTSSRIQWVMLGEMEAAEALELLEKHRPFTDDVEREAARQIVQQLRGFTLAVELVGGHLQAHQSAKDRSIKARPDRAVNE